MKKLLIKYGLSSFKDWLQFIGGIIAISFVVSLAYAIFDFIWSDEYDFFFYKNHNIHFSTTTYKYIY